MGEWERQIADDLVKALSLQEVESLLIGVGRPSYDVDALQRELEDRRARLSSAGRVAESELLSRLAELARRYRGLAEQAARLAERLSHGRERSWPIGFPEEPELEDRDSADNHGYEQNPDLGPRMALERRLTELAAAGRLDEAVAVAAEADSVPPSRPEDLPHIAGSRMNLAGELRSVGRAQQGLDVMAGTDFSPAAVGSLSQDPTVAILATRFHRMRGQLHEDLGRFAAGRQEYALAMRASKDPAVHFSAWNALATSYSKSGLHREALREFRRVLAWAEMQPGGYFVPAALNNLARALREVGDVAAARSSYERVLRMFEEQRRTGTSRVHAWFGIGDLEAAVDRAAEAQEAFRKGFVDAVIRGKVELGLIMLLGRLDHSQPGTEDLLSTALAMAAAVDDWSAHWVLRTQVVRATVDQHRFHGREAEAVAALREQLREAEARGQDRRHLWRAAGELAEELVQVGGQDARQEAFDLVWRVRSELVAVIGSADADGHAALKEQRRMYRLLIDLLVDHGGQMRRPDYRSALELAFDLHEEAKAGDFMRILSSQSTTRAPVTASSFAETQPPAGTSLFAEIRDHLRSGRASRADQDAACALVSFFCDAHSTLTFVYLPDTDRLTVARAEVGDATAAAMTARLRRTFDGAPDDFPPLAPLHPRRPWRRDSGFFRDLTPLLASFLPEVEGRLLLYVSGDGHLSGVPLSAVALPDGQPLAARHAVVHVPSASAMVYEAARKRTRAGRAQEGKDGVVFCAGVAAREDAIPERFEQDAQLLAETGLQVTAVSGEQATSEAVVAGLRSSAIAHLTCHGFFDHDDPLDSGLLLADAEGRPTKHLAELPAAARFRHLLTARDLSRQSALPELVTLRACATGRRDEYAAGGLDGLVQALLFAGAGTVVASLWNCAEQSSRRLLTAFYRSRAARPWEPVWRSLWDVQRAMIDSPEQPWESHPYHWAALAMFGDGE